MVCRRGEPKSWLRNGRWGAGGLCILDSSGELGGFGSGMLGTGPCCLDSPPSLLCDDIYRYNINRLDKLKEIFLQFPKWLSIHEKLFESLVLDT